MHGLFAFKDPRDVSTSDWRPNHEMQPAVFTYLFRRHRSIFENPKRTNWRCVTGSEATTWCMRDIESVGMTVVYEQLKLLPPCQFPGCLELSTHVVDAIPRFKHPTTGIDHQSLWGFQYVPRFLLKGAHVATQINKKLCKVQLEKFWQIDQMTK